MASVAAVSLAGPASAATPPGSPAVRVARAADHAAHPAALREWWTLRLLDPRSKAMLELHVERDPDGSGLEVRRRDADGVPVTPAVRGIGGPVSATARELAVEGQQGRATIALRARGATVRASGEALAGTVELTAARPGPAALGMDLGPGRFNRQLVPRVSLSWAMPIARATARGTLTVAGTSVRVDGWRATHEHGWGQLILEDDAHDLWDTWTVHDGRETVVAFGINRQDTITGPGARDAMWLDVLARAGPRGTRVCRPAIHRTGWLYDAFFDGPVFARRLDARCRGVRARFAGDDDGRTVDDYGGWFEAYGPASVRGRGDGWVVHRGTPD